MNSGCSLITLAYISMQILIHNTAPEKLMKNILKQLQILVSALKYIRDDTLD